MAQSNSLIGFRQATYEHEFTRVRDAQFEDGRCPEQYLNWMLARYQIPACCDRWTTQVSLAQWQRFAGLELV